MNTIKAVLGPKMNADEQAARSKTFTQKVSNEIESDNDQELVVSFYHHECPPCTCGGGEFPVINNYHGGWLPEAFPEKPEVLSPSLPEAFPGKPEVSAPVLPEAFPHPECPKCPACPPTSPKHSPHSSDFKCVLKTQTSGINGYHGGWLPEAFPEKPEVISPILPEAFPGKPVVSAPLLPEAFPEKEYVCSGNSPPPQSSDCKCALKSQKAQINGYHGGWLPEAFPEKPQVLSPTLPEAFPGKPVVSAPLLPEAFPEKEYICTGTCPVVPAYPSYPNFPAPSLYHNPQTSDCKCELKTQTSQINGYHIPPEYVCTGNCGSQIIYQSPQVIYQPLYQPTYQPLYFPLGNYWSPQLWQRHGCPQCDCSKRQSLYIPHGCPQCDCS